MSGILTTSFKQEKKYTRLLNNLLSIKRLDQALFTKVNNIDSFDITSKFGESISQKILNQTKFKINLSEIDLNDLIDIVTQSNSAQEIIEAYDNKKEKLFNTKKILLDDPKTFESTKKELVEKLKENIQKTRTRWIQFRRKIIDVNIQENIWPLHIGTFFVSIKTPIKDVYGPLILKEINIEVNNKITISSQSSWKINEKLIFILNQCGFEISENINFEEEDDIHKISKIIYQQFKVDISIPNISNKFQNFKINDINNKIIVSHPGVVMGLFKSSGGHLRKTMQKIIENNEVDQILDPLPDKNIYKNKVMDFVKNDSKKLFRIQKSNFSQDKALISSLIQDTIIWGPPGTGKSQVIANIIANIFYNQKTAIVMSQKKAALDVLKKRLRELSPFAFFILNDNKMRKEEFYKPLQKFVKMVEQHEDPTKLDKQEIITKKEIFYIEEIKKAKTEKTYYPSLKMIELLSGNDFVLNKIFELDKSLDYPIETKNKNQKYFELLTNKNNLKKRRFLFFSKYPNVVKTNGLLAIKILNNLSKDQNINSLVKLASKTNLDIVKTLIESSKDFVRKNINILDEVYLKNELSKRIMNKINNWYYRYKNIYYEYNRFANAVRAGRRLPYKFVNDHISIIRNLFPIIITTPETTFINWEKKYFDYAILDESSQIFLEIGLPILYLSKIKILAGDNQQMQPTSWFSTRDGSIDEEEDVPENAESLLDYAFNKGVHQTLLNQNFRSESASLMSFSSKQFYGSKLEVIDKNNKKHLENIVVKNVNGEWKDGTNVVEANEVLKIIDQEKDNYKSIIVLTFNYNQRQLIEREIIENYPKLYQMIETEKLTIKNIENIQGDEAELVICSIVYDHTTKISSTYVARSGGKNALNVAISRAIQKMIVVKSITSKTIKVKTINSKDMKIFIDWLEFLDIREEEKRRYCSIKDKKSKIEESYGEVESNFEKEVVDFILEKVLPVSHLKLIKQYEVGSKRIDIALIAKKTNKYVLGIEVDGYYYHQGFEKYLEDYSRQDFLESKGYKIYRIREIDWRNNKDKILNDIQVLLNKNI